jgi:hypothetical protein
MLGRVGTLDIVGMQRQAHDAAAVGALAVERVELVLDHLQEVIGLPVPGEHAGIVGLAGIFCASFAPPTERRRIMGAAARPRSLGHG